MVFPGLIRMARLWNVRYLVTLWPTRHPDLEPLPVPSRFNVYRVSGVLPRAFLAQDFVVVANDEEARRLLLDESHDFRHTVVLHEPPPAGAEVAGQAPAGPGQVSIELAGAHEVRLTVETSGPAFLVLADTFYPGWRAEVDGRPVPVLRANVTQRAVRLEPGAREVRFTFRSRPVWWGAAVSAMSALLMALLARILRAS